MGDFAQKTSSKNMQNRVKTIKISFVLLSNKSDVHMLSCISFSWENGIPLNRLFIPAGRLVRAEEVRLKIMIALESRLRLVHPRKRVARAKACRSHYCKACIMQKCLGNAPFQLHNGLVLQIFESFSLRIVIFLESAIYI